MDNKQSAKYLAWVRQQECLNCFHPPNVQAHHIKSIGHFSGGALKSPDWFAMPLCGDSQRGCHTKMHHTPELWQEQPLMVLKMLERALRDGVIRIEFIGE